MSTGANQAPTERPRRHDARSGVRQRGAETSMAHSDNASKLATERPPPAEVETILLEYLGRSTAPALPPIIGETLPVARSFAPTVRPPQAGMLSTPPVAGASARPVPNVAVPLTAPTVPSMQSVRLPDAAINITHPPTGAQTRSFVRDRGVLVRMDGERTGEHLSLPRSAVVLGRDHSAEIHVHDVGVSRHHARISFESGLYYVEDQSSLNGTFVNGKRVSRAELRNGDCVQLGPRVSFRFTLMDGTQQDVLQRLYDSSVSDPLTGVCNRRHLDTRLEGEVSHAVRHDTNVSVVLFDIDFFKRINDTYGHTAGDEVLRTLADLARRGLRTEDVVARYGGEEFAIILRDTPVEGAHVVAERLRRQVAQTTIQLGTIRIGVTISAGCASLTCEEGLGAKTLVDLADRRLYRAKKEGRNRVVSS